MTLCRNAEVHTGKITGGHGHGIIESELTLLDATNKMTHLMNAGAWEGVWEPSHSLRVTRLWDRVRELLPQAKVSSCYPVQSDCGWPKSIYFRAAITKLLVTRSDG
eukprot:scaffold664020_cov60-Prasinocladus_malaysianus.AAC.1